MLLYLSTSSIFACWNLAVPKRSNSFLHKCKFRVTFLRTGCYLLRESRPRCSVAFTGPLSLELLHPLWPLSVSNLRAWLYLGASYFAVVNSVLVFYLFSGCHLFVHCLQSKLWPWEMRERRGSRIRNQRALEARNQSKLFNLITTARDLKIG